MHVFVGSLAQNTGYYDIVLWGALVVVQLVKVLNLANSLLFVVLEMHRALHFKLAFHGSETAQYVVHNTYQRFILERNKQPFKSALGAVSYKVLGAVGALEVALDASDGEETKSCPK